MTRLGLADEALVASAPDASRTQAVFAVLQGMPDANVLELLAIAMAETLAMGTGLIDDLGQALKVDIATTWQPDDLFFDLVKDRDGLSAMLAEVVGETAARSALTETGPKKKAIIRKALAGDGRAKVETWLPRYMRFPGEKYTDRPLTVRSDRTA